MALQNHSGFTSLGHIVISPATDPVLTLEVSPTVTTSTSNARGIESKIIFDGSGAGPAGMAAQPTFQPSSTISLAYGQLNIAKGDPDTGVSITTMYGGAFRIDTGNLAGTVPTVSAMVALAPSYGSIKPTTSKGLRIENQAPSTSTTNVIGLEVVGQSRGSTITENIRVSAPLAGTGVGSITDCNGISFPAATTVLGDTTGTTTHQHSIKIGIQTYQSTTNLRTITNAASLYIAGAPVASTNVSITNGPYSLWVDAGETRLDGNLTAGGAVLPLANDGGALGSTSLSWSDVFIASGGVINFNNGNATLTHSSGLLTSNVDIAVPDEVYGAGWNGSTEVPTKNAVYDKIESLSGVSPGGSDTQVQFNDSSSFGGDAGLTYNKTTDVLTVAGGVSITGTASQATVINESGVDADFRVEGDTDANLVFADASADKVGIGTASPSEKLHVYGGTGVARSILLETGTTASLKLKRTDSTAQQWDIQTDSTGFLKFIDATTPGDEVTLFQIQSFAGNGYVSYGSSTPTHDVHLIKEKSGGSLIHAVDNTDNADTSSQAVSLIQTGGSSSGDPSVRLVVSGATTWSMGIDNSDSDKLKVGTSATVGTNTHLTIDTSGNVTLAQPLAVASGGTGANTLTGILKGNGTSAVTAVTAPSGAIVGTTDIQTLTNKRVQPRVGTTTSSATPTINTDNVDFYSLTAQATDITSFTTNLSGTPTEGQRLWIAITGTASRAITWGASFEDGAVSLPTSTSGTSRLDAAFVWNSVTSKWRCMASG
jgi:hypothetical protein